MAVIKSFIPCGASLFRGGARRPREQPGWGPGGLQGGHQPPESGTITPSTEVPRELLLPRGTRGVWGQDFGGRTLPYSQKEKNRSSQTRDM